MGDSPTSRLSNSINLNWKNVSIVLGFQDWYIILYICNRSQHISFAGLMFMVMRVILVFEITLAAVFKGAVIIMLNKKDNWPCAA